MWKVLKKKHKNWKIEIPKFVSSLNRISNLDTFILSRLLKE